MQFKVAWDKNNEGKKVYGFFDEPVTFFRDLKAEGNHGYELIQENTRCILYFDIEWIGPNDENHVKMQMISDKIRSHCEKTFDINPELYVSCSTRAAGNNLFKNSYHVTAPNIVFENNHDETMLQFVRDMCEGDFWYYAPGKCYVDTSVYTKNRLVRLPFCSKFGSATQFMRISGDPMEDDLSHKFDNPADYESWRPFILTNPIVDGNAFVVESKPVSRKRERVTENEPPAKRQKKISGSKTLPFPLDCLRELLYLSDDEVSFPTKAMYIDKTNEWQVQCDQSKKIRKCLVKPDTNHESNNCLLFVTKWNGCFKVSYYCTATSCSKCFKPVLGYISFGADCEWHVEVTEPEKHAQYVNQLQATPRDEVEIDNSNPVLNTYALVKQRHEKEIFKLDSTGNYVRIFKSQKEPKIMNITEVRNKFINKYYYAQDSTGRYVEKPFIEKWIRDKEILTFDDIVVDPTCSIPNVFNIWKPFKASLLPAIDDSLVPDFVAPFIHHVHEVITDKNMDATNFVLDYFANMLQRPERKSQVAISLCGHQGCGKGILFDLFRREIMGPFSSFQTDRPDLHLLGRFANGFVHRVLVQIDEVKCLHDHCDQLKNFITCSTLSYEGKNKDSIIVDNYANLVLTSNNENALAVPADDRRFVLFRCKPTYVADKKYFETLSDHICRPEVARAIYQYLMGRDLSKYRSDFQAFRPITEFYRETQHIGLPVVHRYVSAQAKNDTSDRYKARTFYEEYCRFHIAGNYKILMTETAFGREVGKIPGIHKHKNDCNYYLLDKPAIIEYLKSINHFDEDAEWN
jgi:hypothetical protein